VAKNKNIPSWNAWLSSISTAKLDLEYSKDSKNQKITGSMFLPS
jgi:hypothetical protein